MAAAPVPRWLSPLLAAGPRNRPPRARALLASSRPWDEVRRGLASAVLVDPSAARPALVALREAATSKEDAPTRARLRVLEGRAIHRSGRLEEALEAYADAERKLRAAGLLDEALTVGVSRVDALATAGRVDAALALAKHLAPAVKRSPSGILRASLEVNRANALRLRGDLAPAIRAYEGAAADLDKLGNAYAAAVSRVNAGVAMLEAGRSEEARTRFTKAVESFRAKGLTDLEREARYNLAWADVHTGRLGAGIRGLDALALEHREAGLSRREALCRMDLADALRRAGDGPAAEREALRSASAFQEAGARAERAEALWFAAASAAAAGAVDRAGKHLALARREARLSGRPSVALRCEVLLADLRLRSGRSLPAGSLSSLERRARALGQRALEADVGLLAGTSALERGRLHEASRHFREVLRASGGRPWARGAAETGLAQAEARTPGGKGRALARLRRVTDFLDAVRSGLPGPWLRAQFVAGRLDPFLARVDLLLERGRPADRREAEALLGALAARRFLAARPPEGPSPRLARVRSRLEALYDRLARGEGPTRGVESGFSAEAALERRARAWERAIAEAWRRRERRGGTTGGTSAVLAAPSRAAPSLAAGAPASARRVSSNLPAHAAIVHLWRRGDLVRGLLRIGDEVGPGVDLGPAEDFEGLAESLRLRAHRWAFLRLKDASATDPAAAERVLESLAQRLLEPLGVERWPVDVRIAADPTLPDLPWELLPCCGGRLGESHRLLRIAHGVGRASGRLPREGTVVVGVGEPDLPGVGVEIESIAKACGAARVLQGPAATREAVASALSTAKTVHLAGHGWDAEEVPPLGGVRVADGWFTAADLPADGVVADLVVLAACRSGRALGRASLAWGGLVTALLSAGARRVLWTLDDVDDAATARLMTLFHESRSIGDDRAAFGAALARGAAEAGHVGAVLSFRLSGVAP